MGFEVNHSKLMQLGMEWAEHLHFDGTNEFLLELSTRAGKPDFEIYERTIFELQGMGYQVIIAHPERYRAIQEDVEVARGLVKMGCKLQASADFIAAVAWEPSASPPSACSTRTCTRTSQAMRIGWSTTATSPKRSGRTEREERMRVCRFGLTASCR